MAKGFGIAGLVLAILSTVAVYGFNFGAIWLAMLASAVAALNGDRAFSIASVCIATAGLLLFSPLTLAAITESARHGDYTLVILGFVPLGIPIVALAINAGQEA